MVNCRRRRNVVNRLLLVIVTACACARSARGNVDRTEPNEADCPRSKTCRTCTERNECSWSLVRQTCTTSERADGGYVVNSVDRCTRFTVTKKWAVANVFNQIAVRMSDDATGFASYLRKTKITCHLNGLKLKGTVADGERIVCERLRITSSSFPANATALLYSFHVTFDRTRVRFDDDADYYFYAYSRECGDEWPRDCVTCAWNDGDHRHYARKCSARDPCTGAYETYDRRDADGATGTLPAVADAVTVTEGCADAAVRRFEPRYGLRSGGTALTIAVAGHAILAENATAVAVTVAGRECAGPETSADGTIACVTTAADGPTAGPVRVAYAQRSGRRWTVESAETFGYVEPTVTAASPACGPVAGGTLLNLTGEHLDAAGDAVAVSVSVDGRDVACETVAVRADRVLCATGVGRGPGTGAIRLLFGGRHEYRAGRLTFAYAGYPALDAAQTLAGVASGGTALPVRGRHFACVETATFCADRDGARHCAAGGCRVLNDTYMACRSPAVAAAVTERQTLRYGLRVRFAGHAFDLCPQPGRDAAYALHPDPVYDDFETRGRTVVINGRGLDAAGFGPADVTVRFAGSPGGPPAAAECTVVSVAERHVVCETAAAVGDRDAVLRVTVGDALAYDVPVKSTGHDDTRFEWPAARVVAAVSATLTVLVAVLVVALFRYKRRDPRLAIARPVSLRMDEDARTL